MKKIAIWGIVTLMFFVLIGCGKCVHEYDYGRITKEPTCTEKGEKTYTCTLCGENRVEIIQKKAHVYKEEITKEPTFDKEGEKTFTCENCGDSYTESIPVRDDIVTVTVTNKINLPQNTSAGRYSDIIELTFDVMNMADKAIKGIQGKLTICDLFGEEILIMNCDFTGNTIPANGSITVEDLGMDINPFIDEHVKVYNTDFSDLNFSYEVSNIVYEDGSGMGDQPKTDLTESEKVTVIVADKQNLDINYSAGIYSPRVEFVFEVYNNTPKDIKGVQGILTIKDLFGVDIMSSSLDFVGQTIGADSSVTFSDMGIDINEFMDDHVKLYTTDFGDLKFEYKVTSIVYSDGTTE